MELANWGWMFLLVVMVAMCFYCQSCLKKQENNIRKQLHNLTKIDNIIKLDLDDPNLSDSVIYNKKLELKFIRQENEVGVYGEVIVYHCIYNSINFWIKSYPSVYGGGYYRLLIEGYYFGQSQKTKEEAEDYLNITLPCYIEFWGQFIEKFKKQQ